MISNPTSSPLPTAYSTRSRNSLPKSGGYKLTEKQLDINREFIARQLRYNIVAAFYGVLTAERILKAGDPQILRAIEALPRAAKLVTQ
jgi:hypothetical protein